MKRISRRIFTAEFKREAIKLITEQGLTLAKAGKELDVATKSLGNPLIISSGQK